MMVEKYITIVINTYKMGPYLTSPKKDKDVENGENSKVGRTWDQSLIGQIRRLRNARMAQHNGRFAHLRSDT